MSTLGRLIAATCALGLVLCPAAPTLAAEGLPGAAAAPISASGPVPLGARGPGTQFPGSAPALVGTEEIINAVAQSGYYVEPGYGAMSQAEVDELIAQANSARTQLYFALVSNETADAAGGLNKLVTSLKSGVGQPGTYLAADTRSFRTSSTLFPITKIAGEAAASNVGAFAVISEYFRLVEQEAANADTRSPAGGSGGGVPWGFLLIFVALAAAGTALALKARSTSRKKSAAQVADIRRMLDEDVTVIGEQIAQVDQNDPDLGDAGRAHLAAAINAYAGARASVDAMTTPAGAQPVTAALDDARYEMSAVREMLEGRPAPPRRPPCLFDPRHGASVKDVTWAPPPVGPAPVQPRPVPACAECARVVELGGFPNIRMVPAAAGKVPYWDGGSSYTPYTRGYFDHYGSNMLGAILVGTMFGSMMGGGMMGGGMGGPAGIGPLGPGDGGQSDSGGSVGDIGGGDFGGGDFGGGDFGGGF